MHTTQLDRLGYVPDVVLHNVEVLEHMRDDALKFGRPKS